MDNDRDPVTTWQEAITTICLAAGALLAYDLPKLLEDAGRAHAFGPLLDPTLYRAKVAALDEDCVMIRAALPLYHFAKKLEQSHRGPAPQPNGGSPA